MAKNKKFLTMLLAAAGITCLASATSNLKDSYNKEVAYVAAEELDGQTATQTVIDVADLIGQDYAVVSGAQAVELGKSDYYTVKARIHLQAGYNITFYLNSDGNGCNGNPFGGATSFRLQDGMPVMWGWPGAWHITHAGAWEGKVLESGKTYDLEFGIKQVNGTVYQLFVSIDGDVWEVEAGMNEAVFHGGLGTKLAMYSANAVVLETATATCDHNFVWTEADAEGKSEYKCECGVVLDSKIEEPTPDEPVVPDVPEQTVIDVADLIGQDYAIVSGAQAFELGKSDYYTIKARIYLGDGYNVMFNLNTDGSGCNGWAFGGATSFRLKAGTEVQWGWPGAWHITHAGAWEGKILEAGNTYDLEFGIKKVNGTVYTLFVSIDGDVWEVEAGMNDAVFHGGLGTKLGINASGKVIIETSTATCDHNFAWTEFDLNGISEYKCECGIVLDKKVVHILPDDITVYDLDDVSIGCTPGATANTYGIGIMPATDNVALQFKYTYGPMSDQIRFNLACTDPTYAFAGNTMKMMLSDTYIRFSYLDWDGYIGDVYYHNFVSGTTYLMEIGYFDDDQDGYDTWYVKVDGEVVLWLNMADYQDVSIAKGDYVALFTTETLDRFAPVTATEQTVFEFGPDYQLISGTQTIDLGVSKYYTVKARVYLQEGYDLFFFLNTDGSDCNGQAFGGAASFRLQDGAEVQWSWPGAWNLTNAGVWSGKTLEAGKAYNIEIGIKNVIEDKYAIFISIDGEVWEVVATMHEDVFHGELGTKLGIASANAVLFESPSATCAHNIVDVNVQIGCQTATKACSNCQVAIDFVWSHDYTSVDAVEATCDVAGNIAYQICNTCHTMIDANGNTVTDVVVDALGHNYELHAEVSATCSTEGTAAHYTCSACDKYFDIDESKTEIEAPATLAMSAHSMTHYDAVSGTCATQGTIEFWQCSICNKFYADANGTTEVAEDDLATTFGSHVYGEWIPQVDATVDAEGTYGHYHCDVCDKNFNQGFGEMDSIVIPKLPNSSDTNNDSSDKPADSSKPGDIGTDSTDSNDSNIFSGCFGSISGLSVGMITLGGVGLFLKKKKED